MESRPCEVQARAATRRADCAWRKGPRRVRELCGGLADDADESGGVSAPTEDPDGKSKSSSDSESDTDCFESCGTHSPGPEEDLRPSGAEAGKLEAMKAESASSELSVSESSSEADSEGSSSSESESGGSDPFDMETRRRGPLTSNSSDSDSSVTSSDSEESGLSSADSGFAKTSSSEDISLPKSQRPKLLTEVDFAPSAPSSEETEEFGRRVTGLSGRARWQVRKLLAVLTRMRKNLPPSARIEAVRRLGWRLGPGIEACRDITERSGPEPTRVPEGGDQIRRGSWRSGSRNTRKVRNATGLRETRPSALTTRWDAPRSSWPPREQPS
jgi:hypothetical protein